MLTIFCNLITNTPVAELKCPGLLTQTPASSIQFCFSQPNFQTPILMLSPTTFSVLLSKNFHARILYAFFVSPILLGWPVNSSLSDFTNITRQGDIQDTFFHDFLDYMATTKAHHYCTTQWHLKKAIWRECPGLLTAKVLFSMTVATHIQPVPQHNSCSSFTENILPTTTQLDLVPCDFHNIRPGPDFDHLQP